MGTAVALFLVFVVGAGAVFGLFMLVSRLPAALVQRRLDRRLHDVMEAPEEPTSVENRLILKERRSGLLPAVDRLLSQTTRGTALGRWISQAGVKASTGSVLLLATVLAVLSTVAVGLVTRSAWGVPVAAAVGFGLPFLVLRMKRSSRLHAFEEQFPEALDLISRALKAGHAFATGMKMVADEVPEPVGPEFRKTFDEQNFGLPLKDALENLTHRVPIIDVRFFATAVLIQRETGGNLSEILDNLAHVVRERFKILRQVRVYTAHGRLTGYVLLALPAFLAIALMFINPDHMNLLFRERLGQQMLGAALLMQTAGYVWIQKVIKIEV